MPWSFCSLDIADCLFAANPVGIAVMYALSPVVVNDNYPENFILLVSDNVGFVCSLAYTISDWQTGRAALYDLTLRDKLFE